MSDFYSELNARENEALRRARRLGEQEREAAARFNHRHAPPPEPPRPSPPHKPPHAPPSSPFSSILGGSFFQNELFSSPDTSLILLLFFILRREQNDPLLMLALMYILM